MSSSSELVFNGRYRAIYAVDERPGSRTYRCRDDESGRLVLIAELPAADAGVREDLELLARQIATLSIEGLIPLADHFAQENSYYLVCDDPGGQDLERALRMRGGPLPEKEALQQIGRLLDLTGHLHEQKPQLFLGDPLPSDIWVSEDGDWSLTPFTLARPIGNTPSPYRAPELSQADAEPTPASDIYAVGALLYQVMTGWAPPTAEQQRAGMPLNGPRVLNPQISELAEQALLRSLQLRPLNRYQTAREMRIALETVQMLSGRSLGLGPDVLSGSEMLPANTGAPSQPQAPAPPLHMPPPAEAPAAAPPAAAIPYPPPPGYAPGQVPPGAPYAQPAPKRGLSTGCLVALAVLLTMLALGMCLVLGFFIFGSRLSSLGEQPASVSAPTAASAEQPTSATEPATQAPAPTAAPAVSAGAISIANAASITQTEVLTSAVLGPAAYSPDGGTLAVGVSSFVSLVDAESLESRAELSGHTGRITSLSWSADGSLLATGASEGDNVVIVWDAQSGTPRHRLSGHSGWIRSLAFAPVGTTLASGSTDGTIKLWDAETGQLLHTLEGHESWLGGVAFSPDGTRLVSGSRDGTVRLWDVASGQQESGFSFEAPRDPTTTARYWTTGVAFSPDGTRIAVGATDGVVYILDATTGAEQRQLRGHTSWIVIRGVSFAASGDTLYTGSLDGTARIWNIDTGQEQARLAGHQLDIFAIAVNGDGSRLISISDQEGRMLVWDLAAGRPINSLSIGQGIVTSLAFSPDSAVLGSVGYNGIMQLRLMSDGRSRALAGSAAATQALAFLNNARLAAITDQQTVVLLDLGQDSTTELRGLSSPPLSVAASADGSLLASGTMSGTVTLWDGASGEQRGELQGDLPAALLAISSDGERIAVAGPPADPRLQIWNTRSETLLQTVATEDAPFSSIAFQPGGTLLAAASVDGVLRLYEGETGSEVRSILAAPEHGWFSGLAFSPDGTLLATGTPTGLIQFWNPATGAEVASLQQEYGVITLAFSPDGEHLAVSARDMTVRLYGVPRA